MKWILRNLGFLPNHDPIVHLSDAIFQEVERLGAAVQ